MRENRKTYKSELVMTYFEYLLTISVEVRNLQVSVSNFQVSVSEFLMKFRFRSLRSRKHHFWGYSFVCACTRNRTDSLFLDLETNFEKRNWPG